MPWKPLACACLVACAACGFDADYRGGHFTCSDGVCPDGLTCVAAVCVASTGDAHASDAAHRDTPADTRAAALTCADPGELAGGSASGSTAAPRTSQVSSLCAGVVQNGADAVYRIDAAVGSAVHVAIAGDYAVDAYVLAPCDAAPATPACLGNEIAIPGTPIVVTASAAPQFVVVDGENAGMTGTYTLTVAIE